MKELAKMLLPEILQAVLFHGLSSVSTARALADSHSLSVSRASVISDLVREATQRLNTMLATENSDAFEANGLLETLRAALSTLYVVRLEAYTSDMDRTDSSLKVGTFIEMRPWEGGPVVQMSESQFRQYVAHGHGSVICNREAALADLLACDTNGVVRTTTRLTLSHTAGLRSNLRWTAVGTMFGVDVTGWTFEGCSDNLARVGAVALRPVNGCTLGPPTAYVGVGPALSSTTASVQLVNATVDGTEEAQLDASSGTITGPSFTLTASAELFS